MTLVEQILSQMPHVAKPQRNFIISILTALGLFVGRANMTNLHRFGAPSPRTQRRWHKRPFDWHDFNKGLIRQYHSPSDAVAVALDATFLPKSGKHTWGRANFYDSCQDRAHKGLEMSLLALVDLDHNTAWALHARQTPAELAFPKNRTSHYIEHLRSQRHLLPEQVKHVLADGLYANFAFVHGVLEMGLHLVSKLRKDTDLRYLYDGPQKARGARRKFDGKVDFGDLSRWERVDVDDEGVEVYTQKVNHKGMRTNMRVVVTYPVGKPSKRRVLMCTDTSVTGEQVYRWYRARFQIEFLFRDAKQHTGLCDGQIRGEQGLDFHLNASMSALNLLRIQDRRERADGVISIASVKRRNYNQSFIKRIFSQLGLDPTCEKVLPHIEGLRRYGSIAA